MKDLSVTHIAKARELLACPFCGERLFIFSGHNSYGRCDTPDCWMHDRKIIVPLDDPKQVDTWNTRATLARPEAVEDGLVSAARQWVKEQRNPGGNHQACDIIDALLSRIAKAPVAEGAQSVRHDSRPLGRRQLNVLQSMAEYGGRWDGAANGSWVWASRSETASVMEALEKRGLAKLVRDCVDPCGRKYEITDAGRNRLGLTSPDRGDVGR